jgi:uncharacterized OB-fold protein
MAYLLMARLRSWLHCLRHMHRETAVYANGRLVVVACGDCRALFYDPHHMLCPACAKDQA